MASLLEQFQQQQAAPGFYGDTPVAQRAAGDDNSTTQPVPNPPGTPDVTAVWKPPGEFFGPTGDGPGMPTDYLDDDPFKFDTRPGDPGPSQYIGYYDGGAGPNTQTYQTGGPHSTLNPDGSVSIAGNAVTRDVQDEELTSHQLSKLLSSDSKYMQDARRQGMEQANALGGLGGTVGAGASMQAAIRAGLPIAQEDAKAFQIAASENMQALNQYAQLNLQRATELENTQLGVAGQLKNTQINASMQHSIARLEDIRSRDLAQLDAETALRTTEMNGQIQSRMAAFQHQYNSLLEDQRSAAELMRTQMQGDYSLADKQLSGQWESYIRKQEALVQRQGNYVNSIMGAYTGMMDQIAGLSGEMDQDARDGAIKTIIDGFKAQQDVINMLYPDFPPIAWDTQPGSPTGG
jgi:hypothetical protein